MCGAGGGRPMTTQHLGQPFHPAPPLSPPGTDRLRDLHAEQSRWLVYDLTTGKLEPPGEVDVLSRHVRSESIERVEGVAIDEGAEAGECHQPPPNRIAPSLDPHGGRELDRLDSGQDASCVQNPRVSGHRRHPGGVDEPRNHPLEDRRVGLPIGVEHEQELTATDASRVIEGHRLAFVDWLVEEANQTRLDEFGHRARVPSIDASSITMMSSAGHRMARALFTADATTNSSLCAGMRMEITGYRS